MVHKDFIFYFVLLFKPRATFNLGLARSRLLQNVGFYLVSGCSILEETFHSEEVSNKMQLVIVYVSYLNFMLYKQNSNICISIYSQYNTEYHGR